MGMIIQHNLNAIRARNKLKANIVGLKKSSEKLASGYRINRAGDDAAGLAVSEKMRSQIRGLNQAVRNSQDGINMIQTFEGAAQESHSVLKRMKALALEAANGTYDNETDRAAIQLEFLQLSDEIDHIAETDFNGVYMINGNQNIVYEDTIVQVPYFHWLVDPDTYRINAEYAAGSPFGTTGWFTPKYIVDDNPLYIANDIGSDAFEFVVKGMYTNADGQSSSLELNFDSAWFHYYISQINQSSKTNANGEVVEYLSEMTLTQNLADGDIKLKFVQSAIPVIEYLTDDEDELVLDNSGNPIMIGLMWDLSYEITLADDSMPGFVMDSVDFIMAYDTCFSLDGDSWGEYYYITDSEGESVIDHAVVCERPMEIDRFNCHHHNPYIPEDMFKEVTQLIKFDTSSNGPDRLLIELIGSTDFDDSYLFNYYDDLGYALNWQDRTAVDGVIAFSAGTRGLYNRNANKNITGLYEIRYRDELVTEARVNYNFVVQSGARTKDAVNFTFSYSSDGIGDLEHDLNCTASGLGLDKLTLSSQKNANRAIDRLDHAINKVSMVRATLGATQNRLEHKITDLTVTSENLTESESAIRDTDMALEMMNYTKSNILQQAAQAMLSQANAQPQSILQLLG